MEDKSGLYIVAVVGIVAVIAMVILIMGGHTTTTQAGTGATDTTGQAMAIAGNGGGGSSVMVAPTYQNIPGTGWCSVIITFAGTDFRSGLGNAANNPWSFSQCKNQAEQDVTNFVNNPNNQIDIKQACTSYHGSQLIAARYRLYVNGGGTWYTTSTQIWVTCP